LPRIAFGSPRLAPRRFSSVGVTAIVAVAATATGDITMLPFTEEAVARGVSYQLAGHPVGFGFYGFGVGFADFDGDGWPDLFAYGRSDRRLGLFRNLGALGAPGHFVDHTLTSGIPSLMQPSGAYPIDFDGNGVIDLLVVDTVFQPSKLYRQVGDFSFTDVTASSGIVTEGRLTKGCAIADYDGNGYPDIYMCNYVAPGIDSRNQFWRNNGDGTFTDIAPALGLDDPGATLEAVWVDYDLDGDLDLYLSNDRGPYAGFPGNRLFRNDGDGTFTEVTKLSGAAGLELFSMGVAVGDLTGNGHPDFYCTNTTGLAAPLFGAFPLMLNDGTGFYVEAQEQYGVAHPSGGGAWGWGAMFLDFDNDGWLDLYVNLQFGPNRLYHGGPKPPMAEVGGVLGVAGQVDQSSYTAAFADIDGDGSLDLLVHHFGNNLHLHINHEGAARNAVRFRVVGVGTDTQAIGATATLTVGTGKIARTQWRQTHVGGNSYLGVNEQILHFGIGDATVASAATVRWPNHTAVREYSNVPPGIWTAWAPERLGDVDGDGVVGPIDRAAFCAIPDGPVTPGVEIFDFDGDFVIGPADRAAFLERFKGQIADLNGDGVVDGADLGILLTAWGSTDCLADLDGNGIVNGADLGILLAAWSR